MQIAPKKRAGFNRDAPEAQKCRKKLKMTIFMMIKLTIIIINIIII